MDGLNPNLICETYDILSGCHGNGMPLPHPGESAVSSRGAGRESREMRLVLRVSQKRDLTVCECLFILL